MSQETKPIKKTAIIIGAGDFTERDLPKEKSEDILLIAADGGLTKLEAMGLVPDIIIGDFDSLGYVPEYADANADDNDGKVIPGKTEILTLPVEKDDTDMEAAICAAWSEGCRTFRLYGAYGDRPDHFLANLQLIAELCRCGADAQITASEFTVYAITNDRIDLNGNDGDIFSVFTLEKEAKGVSISGNVKYPLDGAVLTNNCSLGVSNQLTGTEASIEVSDGTLLIFLYCN